MSKKRKLLLLLLVPIIVILIFSKRSTDEIGPPSVSLDQETWNELIPGESSVDILIAKMGEPTDKEDMGLSQTYSYPSNNEFYQHKIEITGNIISFIREKIFTPSDRSLEKKINSFEEKFTILNGPNSNSGIFLYAYPEKGIAFLTSPTGDTIYEAWYFSTSTLEEFMNLPQLNRYSLKEIQKLD